MAFVSEATYHKALEAAHHFGEKVEKVKAKAEKKALEIKGTIETVGGGAFAGYARGHFEDEAGEWKLFGLDVAPDLAAGLTAIGLGYFEVLGRVSEDSLHVGNGITAFYTGMRTREIAKKRKSEGKVLGSGRVGRAFPGNTARGASLGAEALTDEELARSYGG